MFFPFDNQINCDTIGFRAWGGKEEELSTQNRNRARLQGCLAPPTRDMSFVNKSTHQRNLQHEILGWLRLSPRLLLLVVAGVSDANCHHELLDLHTEHYDIILEEDKEIGEDRSLQSCCESREKQTQNELDNFPFN